MNNKSKRWSKWLNWARWAFDILIVILGVGTVVSLSVAVSNQNPGFWWVEIVVPVLLAAVFAFFLSRELFRKDTNK